MHIQKRAGLLAFSFYLLVLFSSCGNKVIVDEERSFQNEVWNRFTPEAFIVEIDNVDDYYNIDLTLSIDTTHYSERIFPMTVNLFSPNGERRMFYYDLVLKQNGRWRGEQDGKFRVITERIRSYFSFNTTGSHRLEIGQASSKYDLLGPASLSVYIERTKLDYDM